ncbi:biotin/acetyl-CoA-carboxylase ligase [Cyanobacterium stanieri PCC 7202]|uniref:Biotin/acetyl-CoA-carboxylase ligase n=1 Tax=Cyanobacterium stanieri (strain ATCC 29140 / PCC 7202) TaxID=292563 RepID=K9YJJ5_CYASC|nr:biotin/acetyl-CoA-carboxylase ligase [Cyanobacterium stanieri PCC 7202]
MEKITIELSSRVSFLSDNKIVCYVYESLASTNTQAWELCNQENWDSAFVVVAKQQTAGKGQRGNVWQSSLGGLYLTVVFPPQINLVKVNHLTLFSALGITENFNKYKVPVKIKWLNDLMLLNKKLGGILSEVRSQNGIIKRSIIGVGINWKNSLNLSSSTSLSSYYQNNNPALIESSGQLLKVVVDGIFQGYNNYVKQGINCLLQRYNNYLIYQNQEVIYNNLQGKVLGVDYNSNLMVKFSAMGSSSKVLFSPDEYAISPYRDGKISNIFERK